MIIFLPADTHIHVSRNIIIIRHKHFVFLSSGYDYNPQHHSLCTEVVGCVGRWGRASEGPAGIEATLQDPSAKWRPVSSMASSWGGNWAELYLCLFSLRVQCRRKAVVAKMSKNPGLESMLLKNEWSHLDLEFCRPLLALSDESWATINMLVFSVIKVL